MARPAANHDLDFFNQVGNRTTLTHQNVLYLMNLAFTKFGLSDQQYNVESEKSIGFAVVNSHDERIDFSLQDLIIQFLVNGREKMSICLCRGIIDTAGNITGNTHWTSLHLRRINNPDGTISIQPFYTDSLSDGTIPRYIQRVFDKVIRQTDANYLNDHFRNNPIIANVLNIIPHVNFLATQNVNCPRQTDGYSCGYHSVFNAVRLYENQPPRRDQIIQNGAEQNVNQFIEENKRDLARRFGGNINNFRAPAGLPKPAALVIPATPNPAITEIEKIFISNEEYCQKIKKLILLKNNRDLELENAIKKAVARILGDISQSITFNFSQDQKGIEKNKIEILCEMLISQNLPDRSEDFINELESFLQNPSANNIDNLNQKLANILGIIFDQFGNLGNIPAPPPPLPPIPIPLAPPIFNPNPAALPIAPAAFPPAPPPIPAPPQPAILNPVANKTGLDKAIKDFCIKAVVEIINDVNFWKVPNAAASATMLKLYQESLAANKEEINPKTPYCGIGAKITIKSQNGKIKIKIDEIFAKKDLPRFFKADKPIDKLGEADVKKLEGKFIVALKIGNETIDINALAEKLGGILNPDFSKEVAKLFHNEGDITLITEDEKGQNRQETCCARNRKSTFVSNSCKEVKSFLGNKKGEIYDPKKCGAEILPKYNEMQNEAQARLLAARAA